MWVQITLSIIALPIIIGFTIYKIKSSKSIKSIDVTANQPIVENDYRSEFTEGYVRGVVKSKVLCKNGCFRIEFFPIDVEQGEEVPRPHLQTFIVKKELAKSFSIGELSSHRSIIKTIPRDPSKIPEKMRDTSEGKWATKEGQLAYIRSTFGKAIPAGDEAIVEAMKDYARGGISRAALAKIKEEVKVKKDIIEQPQEENKK